VVVTVAHQHDVSFSYV